jgi:hypothetical protein
MARVAGGQKSERYRAARDVCSLVQRIADGVDLRCAVNDRPVDFMRHRACPPVLPRESKGGAIFRLVLQLDLERAAVVGRDRRSRKMLRAQLFEDGTSEGGGRKATRR